MKNKLLTLGSLACVIAVNAQGNYEKNLILNYQFDEVKNETSIVDKSSKKNHGVLNGNGAVVANGELYLPGGNPGSDAAFIELPKGMFDSQNTLTISVWMKNETGKANCAAIYFGMPESVPTQYWLINPSNRSGNFKTVFTNNVDKDSPWKTEYGISPTISTNGVIGPNLGNDWTYYTTVISPENITSFINGKEVGNVALSRTVSDFGADLVGFIGKSAYNDPHFKGSIKNLKIYNTVLPYSEIVNEYYLGCDASSVIATLEGDAKFVNIDKSVLSDLSLPSKGNSGCTISWKSDAESALSKSGKVKRHKKTDKDVKLTATFTLGGRSITRDFNTKVLASNVKNDVDHASGKYDLGIRYVTGSLNLPTTTGENCTIDWSSNSEHLSADGSVKRPAIGAGDKKVTLTANINKDGYFVTKKFDVTVAEETYGYLMSYILEGDNERACSFFAASSIDGKNFTALNNQKALIYPLAGTKKLRTPSIFRKPEGAYGVIASDNKLSGVIVYHSNDLLEYVDETYFPIAPQGVNIKNLSCEYDLNRKAYVISWIGSDDKYYKSVSRDLKSVVSTEESEPFTLASNNVSFDGKETSVIGLTKNEYDKVTRKFAKLQNTGVNEFNCVYVKDGKSPRLPQKATLNYSDGSSKQLGVEWNEKDIKSINLKKPGKYVVNGTIKQVEYKSPFISQRADPWVLKGTDGYYYFTGSYPMVGAKDPEGYDRVVLRRSKTMEGLMEAEEIAIWDEANSRTNHRYIWAPEIHQINGEWVVLFTTSIHENSVWGIRPHIIRCNQGEKDPMNPACWETVARPMEAAEGDDVSYSHFSLDMTYFEDNGKHYVVWAQAIGHSSLAIATIDPKEPWKNTSKYTLLTSPEYAWEWQNDWVNEGPAVIKNNGKIYMAFSASSVNHTYCVGQLSANEGADLLDINSWNKMRYPILSTEDLPADQNGPGHNSFTVDEDGNPIIVFHARNPEETIDGGLYDPGRHAFVKRVNFAYDGTPVLNMTSCQELNPEFKNVSIEVIVE